MKQDLVFWEEPLAGASFSNIIRLLWQNRFRIHVKYLPRLIYSLVMSAIFTPLRWVEHVRFHPRVRRVKIDKEPVFIIGHYRTGTTYLHMLLSKDRNFGYLSNIEGYLPHTFLAFPRLSEWIISLSLPEKRPMDEFRMVNINPTEEEYSLGGMDKYGYYNGFLFPRNFRQYSKYNSFRQCSAKDLERWKKRYHFLLQKLTLKYKGRQLLLKNPASTHRIPYLTEMYPNAKWIHIYRDPYKVFASSVKFFRGVFGIYALQTWNDDDLQLNILKDYQQMYERFFEDRHLIPDENYVEVRYEDFLKDPLDAAKAIYTKLNLNGFEEAKPAFQQYIDSQKSYRTNVHDINDDVITKVNEYLSRVLEAFKYKKLEATAA